ncbi:winged helix-turn-helix domain-containing protein [Desulfovibrio ferrophilus]|uniref:Putative transcriptional regulator, ModE family n=1 Tax=Desulfovibrio ferrophilus TaxID=241368 RepID=A0A2Z6AXU0_9BACT|nr:LysR family transcriptional regulator [Desulfovibrio ferrophilus]BBD08082.1 putative transcriptional regulator, ModE family [Desulfovibrio ferrophilus]
MDQLAPRMRVKIWLEEDENMIFGPGCAMLLREIERCGSLAGAVKGLKMSYRAAWGHIKKVEDNLGVNLVEKQGGNKSGYSLSEQGQTLLEAYEAWYTAVEETSLKLAQQYFPWPVKR